MEWYLVAIILIAAIIVALIKAIGAGADSKFPYRKRERLFSASERSFLGVLIQAAGDDFVVLGKVRVADVLAPDRGLSKPAWRSAFNRISSKHFDFLLCNPRTLSVVFAVELNDKSHARAKRAKRDAFLRGACESSGLTLIEIEAKASYSVNAIREKITEVEVA